MPAAGMAAKGFPKKGGGPSRVLGGRATAPGQTLTQVSRRRLNTLKHFFTFRKGAEDVNFRIPRTRHSGASP